MCKMCKETKCDAMFLFSFDKFAGPHFEMHCIQVKNVDNNKGL